MPRTSTSADAAALTAHVKALKGSVLAPKSVKFSDAMPLTGVGKVDKRALRARAEAR